MKKIITTISVICVISGLAFSQWLNVEESSITLAPGESITVNVTANGSELLPGNYELPLTITTNDPQLEMVQLPATATIYTKPKIAVVTDVPNDQGGAVFVEFYRCFYDDTPLNADRTPELYTVEMNEGNGWIAVQSLSAYGENSYTALVPTTIDSSATGDGLLNFRVIAAMEEGNWVSDIVQGYSVDNIVPEAPQNLLATTSHQKVNLTWDYPIADDYQYTEIYRNDELVGTTITDSFTDETVTPNTEYEYSVRHLDANNNAGENTILTTRTLSWSIAIDGVMGEINTEFVLGVSEDGSTGFDDGNDIPQPPNPPTDFVNIFTHHPEWEFVLGDKFIQDVMGDIDLADTMQVWEVHLFSDNDGDVVVDFDFSDEVPELPAFIYDEELTYKLPLTDEMTHIFTLSANTESVFYLAIGDNTPPVNAVTYPNGLEFIRSGEEASFTFDATDGYTYENMISMSYDGIEYEEIGLTTDNFIAFTPEHTLSNSCYIKVVTTDFAGNFIEDVSDYEFTVVGDVQTHSLPLGWSLFSSPISFENTLTEQIADDYANTFYAFEWVNGGYSVPTDVLAGDGVWLGFVEDVSFTLSGVPYLESQTTTYSVGWNLVSNPLVRDITKDSLLVSYDGVDYSFFDAVDNSIIIAPLYSYSNGEFTDNDVVQHFDAYWLGVLQNGVDITYAPHEVSAELARTNRDLAWSINCNASMGDSYSGLTVGVADDAVNELDNYDYPSPPMPPANFVNIYTSHPDWEHALGNEFSQDIFANTDISNNMQVWEVHLFSDNDGDVVVDFDFSDEVPELPAFIYDEELTYKLPLTDEMTHIFTLSANTESVFYLAIGDNTPPVNAVTYPNGLEFIRSGEEASFTFDATDGYTYENMISMSYDGIEYEEIGLTTDNFIAFTPEHILSNSCYIKVVTTDFAGNFIEDVSDYEFTVVGGELTHTAETGWILGGSPLSFENTIAEQLSDDTESLFYTYLWENGGYAPVETFEEGYGIWLGFVDNFDFDISGEPYTEPQSIEYPQGWSIISNPLVRDIDITMLSFTVVDETMSYGDAILNGWITEPVYGYDMSDYYPAETLELWSAYWLGVLVEGLTVNYTPHEAQDIREISVREYDWQLTLNNLTIAGEETSSANWDIQDYPLAPIPPASDYIDVAITHPEWEFVLGDRFMSDIRPITTWDEIQEYTLTFTGSGDLPLTWVYENIPETEDIIFTYGDTDYNLRELDELTISIDGYGVGLLRIGQVLSSTEFHIPTEYALNSAYPNPFNPTTTIGYSVPAPSSLLLAIYNINGQLVETLVNTQMEAGYHTIEWDADNQPSGLYFVRMVAGNFVSTQKVLLLK